MLGKFTSKSNTICPRILTNTEMLPLIFRQTHLIVNLIVQILLGVPLEMVHRGWRVVLIYFSGVLAGSLATSIVDPTVYLAGASGGVYALITAHVATIIIVSFFEILIS